MSEKDTIETTKNNSKIYYNGKIIFTKKYGNFIIIGKSKKTSYYFIKFKDGTILEVSCGRIKKSDIKNPNQPSVCGIGYIGQGKHKASKNSIHTPEYRLWKNILTRCYLESSLKRTKTYKNCYVDKRWHNFQNFCEDIKKLNGYSKWKHYSKLKNKKNKIVIDKDIKIKGNKVYSKSTCLFVTQFENTSEMAKRVNVTGLTYIAIRLEDNYAEHFTNQNDFARKYNLHQGAISMIINGKAKKHRGWTFKTKDKPNV